MVSSITVMNFAAPEDGQLLAEWEAHLLPYQQAGQITLWSAQQDPAGQSQPQDSLATSRVVILLLSEHFFANAACQAFMQEALQHFRSGRLALISLLLRPSAWSETALAFLPCLPADRRPLAEREDRDRAFQQCAQSLGTLLSGLFSETPSPAREPDPSPTLQPVPLADVVSQGSALLPALANKTRYFSCFISYAHQDEPFARTLYRDLLARGVPCWLAPHDLQVGAVFRQAIDETIRKHEKLLLILSKYSIESAWTRDEVEAAMDYERHEQREMLFPISLDTSFLNSNVAWVQTIRRAINVGFMEWSDPEVYAQGLERLLNDLKTTLPLPIMRPWQGAEWFINEDGSSPQSGHRLSLIPGGRHLSPDEVRLTNTVIELQTELLRNRTVLGTPRSEASTAFAVAGMVLGIVSIPLLCAYGFGAAVGIVGFILSLLGLRTPSVRGMALTGLILSIISILVGGAFLCLVSQAMLRGI